MRLPAEWEPQSCIWLSWPSLSSSIPSPTHPTPSHWQHLAPSAIAQQWARLAATISLSQIVAVNAPALWHDHIRASVQSAGGNLSRLHLYPHETNDVWCRDHGAIFIQEQGQVIATDWQFNGWGGNFAPWGLDNTVAQAMATAQGLPCRSYPEVLEGGAIESNGAGTLLTTRAVLLNPNRNPHLDQPGVEQMLASRLGINHVVWLEDGIVGDDTGGHIDDIARYVATDTIVISTDPAGPNQHLLQRNQDLLRAQSDAQIIELPMPQSCELPGWRLPTLPASYVNFLITNELVLVPTFRQARNDQYALDLMSDLFPQREVIGIDALDIVSEGGALHCISMQQPVI